MLLRIILLRLATYLFIPFLTVNLLNGFYLAQLEGLLKGWQCDDDGEVTQVGGSATLDRAQQQIIVLYVAIDITRNELRQLKAVFKAKAGPNTCKSNGSGG